MDTVSYVSIPDPATNISKDFAIITHADGSQTSMLKADYDAAQVAPQA